MDLPRIKQALMSKLTHDSQFLFLNTRVILRTGVDLSNLRPKDAGETQARRVLQTLKELGYDLHTEVGR